MISSLFNFDGFGDSRNSSTSSRYFSLLEYRFLNYPLKIYCLFLILLIWIFFLFVSWAKDLICLLKEPVFRFVDLCASVCAHVYFCCFVSISLVSAVLLSSSYSVLHLDLMCSCFSNFLRCASLSYLYSSQYFSLGIYTQRTVFHCVLKVLLNCVFI